MKISEILRKAADEQLDTGSHNHVGWFNIADAIFSLHAASAVSKHCAADFCRSLGLADTVTGVPFEAFTPGEQRQGARFLFLDFAALVAESEGL
jgi:hypothetical protein